MVKIQFKGNSIHTSGSLPEIGQNVPHFTLIDKELKSRNLSEFKEKKIVLATVPSLDTGVCSSMTKHLNEIAKKNPNVMFLVISADLPFAQKRFCEHEAIQNILVLSMMRDKEFGKSFGLLIQDGPLAGLLARSVMVIDPHHRLSYLELAPEITKEINYEALSKALAG